MQREILFRGWFECITGASYWVYGYLNKQSNGNWEIINGENEWTVSKVGQFTGLLDKNGKKVFFDDTYRDPDGDVFKVTQNEYGTYVLEMISNGFIDEFIDWDKIEIIGNIHDNPELLKLKNNTSTQK